MATEHDRVSADEARRLLEGTTRGPWNDVRVGCKGNGRPLSHEEQACNEDGEGIAIVTHDGSVEGHANTRLMYAAPRLAATVVALHAEVARRDVDLRHEHAAVARLEERMYALHNIFREIARACTLPEDTAPAALPGAVEACIRDLSGQIERLTLASTATTGAEDALAGLVALKPAAALAYLKMDGNRTDAITPEVDSDAEQRLALTLDLGGTEGDEPWQALVIYDAGMGTVPVVSGECCGTPLAAVASLRAAIEHGNDEEGDSDEFDHV